MATRALPDLIARIRVDSSGIDSAMTNLVGSFGRANLAIAGVAAGLGLVVFGIKSMVDITESWDSAQLSLNQAVTAHGLKLTELQGQIDDFIKTNRRNISSQAEVVAGYAALIREGVSVANTNKDMAIAVNIAAIQQISLSDAVTMLQAAEGGRTIGLKKLVGITLEAIPAHATLAEKEAIVAHNMDIVAAAYRNGTDALTPLQHAQDELNITWQQFALTYGPQFIGEMTRVISFVSNNMPTWITWLNTLVNIANQLAVFPGLAQQAGAAAGGGGPTTYIGRDVPAGKYSAAVRWDTWQQRYVMDTNNYTGPALPADSIVEPLTGQVINKNTGVIQRAGGGPVLPGGIYTVGEAGPETLVMGASGGTVIPNNRGGGGGPTINFHQVMADPWQISNELAWLKKTRRL